MLIYEIDRKIIYLIVVSLSLFFGVLPMDHVASSLSKHGRDAQESDEQPAAKVQKTEHSVDVASHKMKKEVVKHFKEIAKSSGELNENLRAFIDENPNIRDKRGNTLLHYALLFNNDKLISFLIHNSKVDITICNDEGLSLLALAVQQNNDRAVFKILKKAPISGERLNGFMLEVYALFEKTLYLMNNPPIIKMFENFIAKNEPLKKDASLPSAMHCIQLPNYQKNSAKKNYPTYSVPFYK